MRPRSDDDYRRYVWERAKRVTVYDSPRRARYPSITETRDGSLLVLLTRQTAEQEAAGLGDLVVVRSSDGGESWSQPTTVFEGRAGEPRAVGTMTTLKSGRIVAPFAELGDSQATSTVRLAASEDGGESWSVGVPNVTIPLTWWAPCGKVIETADGTLAMPVYGATSKADLGATIHNCGILRSTDGGETWGDFSWLARGGGHMIGAAPAIRFSFQGPSVQPLADGSWLAIVSARRLNRAGDGPTKVNEGPGAPEVLARLWSRDEGRKWTAPDQLMPGAWPSLAVSGRHALCVNTHWCAWGEMNLQVSSDGFHNLYQGVLVMNRGWTQGMTNRPQETPLPPTVPYLADEWPFERYGFPSALPVGDDGLIVVFDRTRRGAWPYKFDPPEWDEVPWERECIQAVFFRRSAVESELTAPLRGKRPRPKGRWVLSERIIVPDVTACMDQTPDGELIGIVADRFQRSSDGGRTWKAIDGAGLPPGDREMYPAFGILRSGRWLVACSLEHAPSVSGKATIMGSIGGYSTFKDTGYWYDWSVVVSYSDDEGKTWHAGEPFKGPFKWALTTVAHFIESPDGTVALPIYGCVTDEENDSYSSSNGVMRSHDGGETWGDFSFVFRTNPKGPDDFQPEPRYSEMDIVQLPNGHWVAYSRDERLSGGPGEGGATKCAVSTDFGRTWTRTGGSLLGVSQQKGIVLSDGAIALTYRATSWQTPGVAITYDEGRTFAYLLAGPYETCNAFAHGDDEFVIFTARSHRSDMSAGVYRWIPNGP